MPGYEVIGSEELIEVQDVFGCGGIPFRHGFDALRNNCYKVREFEQAFAQAMGVNHALAKTKSRLKMNFSRATTCKTPILTDGLR